LIFARIIRAIRYPRIARMVRILLSVAWPAKGATHWQSSIYSGQMARQMNEVRRT
jgi:hypothetical protein